MKSIFIRVSIFLSITNLIMLLFFAYITILSKQNKLYKKTWLIQSKSKETDLRFPWMKGINLKVSKIICLKIKKKQNTPSFRV